MHVTAKPAQQASATRIKLTFTVIVERDGDSYHAYCPAFKGLHVDGNTVDEALRNAQEAANVYLNSLALHGDPLPIGPDCSVEEEHVQRVPPGALLRHLELQWPSQNTSGIS
jgi:predicted RNase H-like HicB family nuclease